MHSLKAATHSTDALWATVQQLFDKTFPNASKGEMPPIRLIGMGVGGFDSAPAQAQLGMFDEPQAEAASIDSLADAINNRFGHKLLSRARGMRRPD